MDKSNVTHGPGPPRRGMPDVDQPVLIDLATSLEGSRLRAKDLLLARCSGGGLVKIRLGILKLNHGVRNTPSFLTSLELWSVKESH